MTSVGGHMRYPRRVTVNFKRLEEKSLWNYVSLHNIELEGEKRPTKEELEVLCAQHFADWEVDEEKVLESWLTDVTIDRDARELGAVRKPRRHRSEYSPYGPYGHGEAPDFGSTHGNGSGGGGLPGALDSNRGGIVPVGEQVAAQYTNANENGSWILAEIVRYLAGRGCYEVKDADDETKTLEVPADGIIRLRDGGEGFAKGDHVLAVFPDTTSFYRGTISKQPVRKGGTVSEFEDDEDETGKTPHRRINAKLVLPQPDPPYYDGYRGGGGAASGSSHGVYEEPHQQHGSRWVGNDDGGRRGGHGGGGGGYDDGYYPGGVDDGGSGAGGGAWDDDLARPPKKTKRRMMGGGSGSGHDISRGGGSRGGNRGMSSGFR